MELTKKGGVVEVIAVEKKMGNNITMEHCFGEEKKQEPTKRKKKPRWLLCSFKKRKTNYIKGKIYLRQQLVEDENSPFQKIEPHRKFNTQWGTVYSRDLFTREEILEMCPEDIIDIHVLKRNDNSRLTGPPDNRTGV